MFQPRRGIIFDLDNTLITTTQCQDDALCGVQHELIATYDATTKLADEFLTLFKNAQFKLTEGQTIASNFDWFKLTIGSIVQKLIPSFSEKNMLSLCKVYEDAFFKDMVFSEEIISMLQILKKDYKLCILTNGPSRHQLRKLVKSEANKYMDVLMISGDYNTLKPDPKLFHTACRKLGLENRQCIMVGDNLFTDILGARNAGLKANVYVECKEDLRERDFEADYSIKHVTQLLEILKLIKWE